MTEADFNDKIMEIIRQDFEGRKRYHLVPFHNLKELAESMDWNYATVRSIWNRPNYRPTVKFLWDYCSAINVPVEELVKIMTARLKK